MRANLADEPRVPPAARRANLGHGRPELGPFGGLCAMAPV